MPAGAQSPYRPLDRSRQGVYRHGMAKEQMCLRLDSDLLAELRAVTDRTKTPYAPTQVAVVERGLRLALNELKRKGRK